jgi:hypothetical protein
MATGDGRTSAVHAKCMDGYLAQLVAIRSHNDELRARLRGGTVSLSHDVQELGPIVVAHALVAMTETTEFDDEEHQSGRFIFCARMFRWSISYSDSRNPANAKITKRELHLIL